MMHRKFAEGFSREGRPRDAVAHYKEALALGPGTAVLHNGLGVAFAKLKDYGLAYEHFSEALRLDPDLNPARKNLESVSKLLKQGGQPDLP